MRSGEVMSEAVIPVLVLVWVQLLVNFMIVDVCEGACTDVVWCSVPIPKESHYRFKGGRKRSKLRRALQAFPCPDDFLDDQSTKRTVFNAYEFAGHCFRSSQFVADFILWIPSGKCRRGQGTTRTFPVVLSLDTDEFSCDMLHRQSWRNQISLSSYSNYFNVIEPSSSR